MLAISLSIQKAQKVKLIWSAILKLNIGEQRTQEESDFARLCPLGHRAFSGPGVLVPSPSSLLPTASSLGAPDLARTDPSHPQHTHTNTHRQPQGRGGWIGLIWYLLSQCWACGLSPCWFSFLTSSSLFSNNLNDLNDSSPPVVG